MHPPSSRHRAAEALTVGEVIAGKYAIVRVLGAGGMGIVYEATHLKLRQRVAVKMLQHEMLEHPTIVTRFEREARAAGQLRNRHTARVTDVDSTAEGLPYMVMEFLEGNDLETELGRRGRFAVEEAVDCVLQACSAMIEAHKIGIVHRDLKPANLFLALDGDARIIKVLDFGISKVQDEGDGDAKLTMPDSVMGTALYMSPEQVRSPGNVDARTDIWSLGIILYELLTGQTPWLGTPTQLAAAIVTEDPPDTLTLCEVPFEIVAVIGKALKRDPAERYADVKQLAIALAPFASSTGPGRILAEGLLNSASTGSSPRLPAVDRLAGADTVRADAVNAPRAGDEGFAPKARVTGEGTAPGWSQHQPGHSKHRTAFLGVVVSFAVGLVVLGLGALAYLRWGVTDAQVAAALSASQAAASAPPPQASVSDPPVLATHPSPPPAVVSATLPQGSASGATHPRAPVRGASSPPPPRPPPSGGPLRLPASPRPRTPASTAPATNPLTL